MTIEHISDTARWVAVYRAMETERPDAIFRDPFAHRLAGPEGAAIVDGLRQGKAAAWAMIVRTALIDEFIRAALAGGVDLIVNLAAGLDARPWRMELPPLLRWVDVDLPGILDYKLDVLADETPHCAYEAIRADLTGDARRREVLAEATADSEHALVVTEGLLIYLTREQVSAIASDLHAIPAIRSWVIDLASPRMIQWIQRSWSQHASDGAAPFQFAPEEGTDFFEPLGWREAAFRSMFEESFRLDRTMRMAWLIKLISRFQSRARREETSRMSGVVLLERGD
jgi:methyltransferase (TIGR00027 family)